MYIYADIFKTFLKQTTETICKFYITAKIKY